MFLPNETSQARQGISAFVFVLIALVFPAVVCSSPDDEQVARFLKSNQMFSLLEVQIEDRISRANADERAELTQELSALYLEQLRAAEKGTPYYNLLLNRARSLVARMGSTQMFELRIELLVYQYLEVEPDVQLNRLELLDLSEKAHAVSTMKSLESALSNLTKQLDPLVAKMERAQSNERSAYRDKIELPRLRRFRSLAHYYHAWVGYSLASLQGQHVPNDVFVSFGWLLGAKGEMPQYSLLNKSTLEFEHVARSAIGLALAYAQSDDQSLARSWAKSVVYSEHVSKPVQDAAMSRFIQILAIGKDWTDLDRLIQKNDAENDSQPNDAQAESSLSVSDARFLALRSLEAMQSGANPGQGGQTDAKSVAKHAIGALVSHGEVGHVLELYRRFDSLPILLNSFITIYAQALADLNDAEHAGDTALYSSVALRFARALESKDASQFPAEQDDCAIKLAYCELRAQRASEAVAVCEKLIERTESDTTIEEARWLRIAALATLAPRSSKDQSNLTAAVRQYIVAYPSTPKSAKLILRHAMQGAVDQRVAIETLESIPESDPIALPARRALIGLFYEHSKSIGYTDGAELEQIVELVRWVYTNELPLDPESKAYATQMGTTRIGLDIIFRLPDPDIALAIELVQYGQSLMRAQSTLQVYQSEFMYRAVQITLIEQDITQAIKISQELRAIDSQRATDAQALVLYQLMRAWHEKPSRSLAKFIVDIGPDVLAAQSPSAPDPLSNRVSQIAETVAQASKMQWVYKKDQALQDLAMRLTKLVLDRGRPSEAGLIFATQLADEMGNQRVELQAWLMLLASYESDTEQWYHARYESLGLLFVLDPPRATAVYRQFQALHPTGSPEPWASKFQAFDSQVNATTPTRSGGQP